MGEKDRGESRTARSKLVEIRADQIVCADWNYKNPGKPEEIAKLAASINADKSAGVIPVRELGDGRYEVIDGNHRKLAIDSLGWKTILCENFGPISVAEAITIARRRNYQWFKDDLVKLGELYRDAVLPHLSADLLDQIMPEGIEGMEALVKGLSFEWGELPSNDGKNGLSFGFTPARKRLWDRWVSLCESEMDIHDRGEQFNRAILTAIKTFDKSAEMSSFEVETEEEVTE